MNEEADDEGGGKNGSHSQKSIEGASNSSPLNQAAKKYVYNSITGRKPAKKDTPKGTLSVDAIPFVPDAATPVKLEKNTSDAKSVGKSTQPAKQTKPRQVRKPVEKPNPLVGKDTAAQLKSEIDQLKRRYSCYGNFSVQYAKTEEEKSIVQFYMKIEDPDFPFDLEKLKLKIGLPFRYPKEGYATFEVLNDTLPDGVRRRIQNRMDECSEKMPSGELNIKPLLRILERNLEKWMVSLPLISASSSSVRIFSPNEITISPKPEAKVVLGESPKKNLQEDDLVSKSLKLLSTGVPIKKELASQSRFQPADFIQFFSPTKNQISGSIQMELKGMSMMDVGIVIPIVIGLSLKCERCHHLTVINDLRPDVDRYVPCSHCKQYGEVKYIRELIHGSSTKLGYLHVKRTLPTELLPCTLQIQCGNCTPPEGDLSSSLKVENVQIGENLEFNCRFCSSSIGLQFDNVIWTSIPNSFVSQTDVKISKLPTKIGEPLPEFGTCSHFRKSCRWFRFPCCGRAFPCEECHNKDSASRSHPPEWANRQICGFCSREFPISQKQCECGEVPGAAKSTAHWEGGKGMRDQTHMSKKDKKKYSNQGKTISRKAKQTNN